MLYSVWMASELTFLRSKHYDVIPFLWNLFVQNSFENHLIQIGPKMDRQGQNLWTNG